MYLICDTLSKYTYSILPLSNCPLSPGNGQWSKLQIRKRKSRSLGIRKKGNGKRKKRAVKRSNTSLKDLS